MVKTFKISLLGEGEVGKTSIINAFIKNQFNYDTLKTVGIDSYIQKRVFDNLEYKFKIFDTAGQERYKSICSTTIQIADGFLMVFAVNDQKSFKKIVDWIAFIEEYVNLEEKVLFIIGNKIDVKPEEREVTKEEAEIFAKSKNAKYFETSALSKEGIKDTFEEIFKDIHKKYQLDNNRKSNFNLERNNLEQKKRKKC